MDDAMSIAADDRTLTITLHRDLENGQWYVGQIETRYGPVRNNIRFSLPMNARETFSPDFFEQLAQHLPGNLNQQVFTISGPAITTKTMTTEGMRVMAQAAKHGLQRVIIRFNRVFGRIYDFLTTPLRPDVLPENPASVSCLAYADAASSPSVQPAPDRLLRPDKAQCNRPLQKFTNG